MTLLHTFADAAPHRTRAWAFVPKGRHSVSDVRSRNAFYGATPATNEAIEVHWDPQYRFAQAGTRAVLQCIEGTVEVWIAREALFPYSPFSLDKLPPDLPHALRSAALQELLGGLLRRWASAHGLTLLALQCDAQTVELTGAQQEALAFCCVRSAPQQAALLAAACSASSRVHARLGHAARCSAALLSCTTRISLRTPPMHLSVAQARSLAPGDGFDLGALGADGMDLVLYGARDGRARASLKWKGNRMTIDHGGTPEELAPPTETSAHTEAAHLAAPPAAMRVDQLSLRLSVEVASLDVPVGEMALWRAGHVMNLDLPLDSAAVNLLVNERVVGHGQIVALGDRLAVEVTEWTLNPSGTHAV
jgi:flagellar motor switch/type III secretory pathway protein FliN